MRCKRQRIDWDKIMRMLVIVLGIWLVVSLISGAVRDAHFLRESYCVQPGDNLWTITTEHKPNWMTYDEYKVVLYKLNPELTPKIYPGDEIIIPIWEDGK